MIQLRKHDPLLLGFKHWAGEPGLVHAITTKPFHLAPHRGPGAERAIDNRKHLCTVLDLDFQRLTAASQIHGGDVLRIRQDDVGRGRDARDTAIPFVDGLITDRVGVPLISLSADCATIMAFDPVRRALGIVHASWRGTLAGAASNLIRRMQQELGCRPHDVRSGIGPSAGPCCYEVGEDLRRVAATRSIDVDRLIPRRNGRFYFDLPKTLEDQLIQAGVPRQNIEQSNVCTICDERFFSHRRDGPDTGRFGLICALRES